MDHSKHIITKQLEAVEKLKEKMVGIALKTLADRAIPLTKGMELVQSIFEHQLNAIDLFCNIHNTCDSNDQTRNVILAVKEIFRSLNVSFILSISLLGTSSFYNFFS